MRIFIASFILVSFVSRSEGVDLGKMIAHSNIFEMTPAEFLNSANQPGQSPSFGWVSKDMRNVCRYPRWPGSPPVNMWGLDMYECLATFGDGGNMVQMKISFYNKGDSAVKGGKAAMLSGEDAFIAYFKKVNTAISTWAGSPGKSSETERMMGNRVKIREKFWVKEPFYVAKLEWSYSGRRDDFVGHFITLTLTPLTKKTDPRIRRIVTSIEKAKSKPSARDLVNRVTKNFRGDVFIGDFPMVDQGDKGYCVVATLERVLQYFGSDVDQHLLAQLCGSSGVSGTSVTMMEEALKRAGVKLGVRVRDIYSQDVDPRDVERIVSYYNRLAKRKKEKEIPDGLYKQNRGGREFYDYHSALNAMNWDIYKKVKLKHERVEYGRFTRALHSYINQGLPLIWSVRLGEIPEAGLEQAGGYHMRTIIGYNDKTNELIYSDSWGSGHEFKKMAVEDAWSITMSVYGLIPRR